MSISTVETASRIDESDVDALPTLGNPGKKCPLTKRYWEFLMSHPDVTDMGIDTWLQLYNQYLELRELEDFVVGVSFESWAYMEHTTNQCYKVYDPAVSLAADIDAAWAEHDTPVFAPILSAPTHKVAAPTASLGTSDTIGDTTHKVAPKRRTRLQHRQVFDKRTLTHDESQLLKSGVLPPTVTDWRLIKLGRRQRTWYEEARHGKRPKLPSVMRRPRGSLAIA